MCASVCRVTPAERWSDDRLDELVGRVKKLEARVEELPGTHERLKNVEGSVVAVGRNLDGLVAKLELREQETQKARQEALKERKSDRRWLIGTVFTSAGFIITALNFLGDRL